MVEWNLAEGPANLFIPVFSIFHLSMVPTGIPEEFWWILEFTLEYSPEYCTISIDSAWGVNCDQMDDNLTMSNVGVTWDTV